ncbi:FGGY family carbohydrate kinase [Frigoribacterium sp. PhB24]|uniref:FGGY family carbohydrate kinase n=1 Tax=Frigoribacterium sp. PhB24 TaxID=2485204 RepID=UPI000F480F77|nr:FGGY family carbohydrate kinase [Frigoribacterium sp. PhB24]ROS48901.1 xylulokinase [Frigoribacterium sp. PhB24]
MTHGARTDVVCGVDVGTSNVKVIVLDRHGAVVARVVRTTPRDELGLSVDVDGLLRCIEDMIIEACSSHFSVVGVCTAGIGEDGILVDHDGHGVSAPLAWFDPRRQSIFRELSPLLGSDESFDVDSDPARTMVGWAWARSEAGAEDAAHWVALTDLPAVRWTGRPFMSESLASRTGARRSREHVWSSSRIGFTLGSVDLLPPVRPTGHLAGPLFSQRLRDEGVLGRDAVVVVGGHDHLIAGWGAEQLSAGAVLDSMGTAEVIVARPTHSTHPARRHFDIAPSIDTPGFTFLRVEELARNVQWASQDPEVAGQIQRLLHGAAPIDSILEAGHFIPGRRGGGTPAYALDAPSDSRSRATAVLGALAVAGREAVRDIRPSADTDRTARSDVWLAGGWARSPGWVAIKTAVNGFSPRLITEPELTGVSAALLAATGIGWTPDAQEALQGSAGAAAGRQEN